MAHPAACAAHTLILSRRGKSATDFLPTAQGGCPCARIQQSLRSRCRARGLPAHIFQPGCAFQRTAPFKTRRSTAAPTAKAHAPCRRLAGQRGHTQKQGSAPARYPLPHKPHGAQRIAQHKASTMPAAVSHQRPSGAPLPCTMQCTHSPAHTRLFHQQQQAAQKAREHRDADDAQRHIYAHRAHRPPGLSSMRR